MRARMTDATFIAECPKCEGVTEIVVDVDDMNHYVRGLTDTEIDVEMTCSKCGYIMTDEDE